MENFSYSSYPDSGDSSPRSREIDFENPPPWEDQPHQLQNYKVKFMCSYGGKILPRPHDNQLCYIGGETKILAVDRNTKFASMVAKLSALYENDVSFKYQLPGEELDALISVSNDDDLEHMMHEYDRLYRATAKPARMRLFLFPVVNSGGSFGSEGGRSDRDQFVDALNSGPNNGPDPSSKPPLQSNVDYLFGLEKTVAPPQPPPTVPEPLAPPPEYQIRAGANRVYGSNPPVNSVEIQRHLQNLQIEEQEQAMYRRKSDEIAGGYAGDYYIQKLPEKLPPMSVPVPVSAQQGYWPEKHVNSAGFPATVTGTPAPQEQPVYMIPAPGAVYHQPMMRQVTGPTGQAYYPMQRTAPEVYREQPVYNMVQQPQQPHSAPPQQPNLPPQASKIAATYGESVGMVRPNDGVGIPNNAGPYTHVGYDGATGRQVYYTAPGGMMMSQPQAPPQQQLHQQAYSAVAAPSAVAETRSGGPLGQEAGKMVVTKVSQGSV
ncbi:hypothetical protein UlMin_042720 [Ulmus minor]